MSVSGEGQDQATDEDAGRPEIDPRENGVAYARQAVDRLADSLQPGDDFADKHLAQAVVHAVLAVYCELRGQSGDRSDGEVSTTSVAQSLAELTEAVRANTAALAEHTRTLRDVARSTDG